MEPAYQGEEKGKFISAFVLANGGLVLEANETGIVHHLQKMENRLSFNQSFGGGNPCMVKPRTYTTHVKYIPISCNVKDPIFARVVEQANRLEKDEIIEMDWVKAPERREADQQVANVRITTRTNETAEHIQRHGLIVNGSRLPAYNPNDDIRHCYNCQGLDGHFAAQCKKKTICGKCGDAHDQRTCTLKNMDTFFCINCQQTGHATWDRNCPAKKHERRRREEK
ncbi:hypothetical protein OF83DRAFT_1073038, partial [Amylostereum chailletii]